MNDKTLVAPSLLASDLLNIQSEIQDMERCGADWHHVDVMDGHFVPNLTFGLPVLAALKKVAKIPLDVHIMVDNPDEVALEYVKAGADRLSFPIETAKHPHRLCEAIRTAGAKAGVAVNPGTPIEHVMPLLPVLDLVNVMSVNPGFSGQKFIPGALSKIEALRAAIDRSGLKGSVLIQCDGGVNTDTAGAVVAAGADVIVAGYAVYRAADRPQAIKHLQALAQER